MFCHGLIKDDVRVCNTEPCPEWVYDENTPVIVCLLLILYFLLRLETILLCLSCPYITHTPYEPTQILIRIPLWLSSVAKPVYSNLQCSVSCGEGTKSRVLKCKQKDMLVNSSFCAHIPRPVNRPMPCTMSPCTAKKVREAGPRTVHVVVAACMLQICMASFALDSIDWEWECKLTVAKESVFKDHTYNK